MIDHDHAVDHGGGHRHGDKTGNGLAHALHQVDLPAMAEAGAEFPRGGIHRHQPHVQRALKDTVVAGLPLRYL